MAQFLAGWIKSMRGRSPRPAACHIDEPWPSCPPQRPELGDIYLPRIRAACAIVITALAVIPSSIDAQQLSRFLPGGKLVPVIRADPREPAAGAKLVGVLNAASQYGTGIEGEALIGHSIPFVLLSGDSRERATVLGLQGAVFGRFQMETAERELISTDWLFAIPLVIWRGRNWYRFRYRHRSAHLGDEYIEDFNTERSDFSRDAFEITVYRNLTPGFSAYAGGDFAVNVQPVGSKRFRVLWGIELEDVASTGAGRFFGGVDVNMYQDNDWRPRVNVQAGVLLLPEQERRLRFVMDMAFGRSIQGEFYREAETVIMMGMLIEL